MRAWDQSKTLKNEIFLHFVVHAFAGGTRQIAAEYLSAKHAVNFYLPKWFKSDDRRWETEKVGVSFIVQAPLRMDVGQWLKQKHQEVTPRSEDELTSGAGGPPGGTGGTGGTPKEPPKPPSDAKVPVITITDARQIEDLKKKGLLGTDDADKIKARLEKQEALSYEEAVKLIDGLNRVTTPPSDKAQEGKDSWLKWSRLVQENKEKLSGKSKSSADGMTVEEVKAILAKYTEYVGVADAPTGEKKSEKKDFDPTTRKAWNDLADWEKTLWAEYRKDYPGGDGDKREDLHLKSGDLFIMALRMSPQYMPSGAAAAAKQLISDPIFIGTTTLAIGGYLGLWTIPEPVSKGVAAVITVTLLSVFSASEIMNLARAWGNLSSAAASAQTLEQLDAAAKPFGKAVGGSGVRILVMLATIFGGKMLPKGAPTAGGGPGPGGMQFAPVSGGGTMAAAAEGAAIKVLSDGTIIILTGDLTGQSMMASQGRGGGRREETNRDREKQRRREENRAGKDEDYEPPVEKAPPAATGEPAQPSVPAGMRPKQWDAFKAKLNEGLKAAGYEDVKATVQGSGATGKSAQTGAAFDEGRVSDYDVALDGPSIVKKAQDLGIKLKGPLKPADLARLGLEELRNALNAATERFVNFLIVAPQPDSPIRARPGIPAADK